MNYKTRRVFFVQAKQSRVERAAAHRSGSQGRRPELPGPAQATRSAAPVPSRWRRSTTLTDSVRRDAAASERGREDSEDRSDRNAVEGTCPWLERGGGPPTRQRAGPGAGKARDRGAERNKVPGGSAAWERRGMAMPAGLCRIGPEMRWVQRQAWCGATIGSGNARSQGRGFRGHP